MSDWHARMEALRLQAQIDRAAGRAYKAHASHFRNRGAYAPDSGQPTPLDRYSLAIRFQEITAGFADDIRWTLHGHEWEGFDI